MFLSGSLKDTGSKWRRARSAGRSLDGASSTSATDVRHHGVDPRLPAGVWAQEHIAGS